jgi:DNA-binding transcriptional MerR regulator
VTNLPVNQKSRESDSRSGEDHPGLTIDELARQVGMSVRNLREWRALGLLPAPAMRGRVGYYDEGQVLRIGRIRKLHADGFPLDLIRRLLDASGDAAEQAMAMAGALRSPFRDLDPPAADLAALAEAWGVTDPDMLRRAVELGLLRQRANGEFEFTSARVARVGEALHRLGLSAEETLQATAEIRGHLDGIADVFDRVWAAQVWQPFVDAGMPDDRWREIRKTLDDVQPIALDAVIGLFAVAMDAKIEQAIARETQLASAPPGRRRPGSAPLRERRADGVPGG